MAEREGFEPSIEFPLYTLSKRAPSTTRPSLRRGCGAETSVYHAVQRVPDPEIPLWSQIAWKNNLYLTIVRARLKSRFLVNALVVGPRTDS